MEIIKLKANLFRFFLFAAFFTMLFPAYLLANGYYYGAVLDGQTYFFINDGGSIKTVQNILIKTQLSQQGGVKLVDKELIIDAQKPRVFRDIAMSQDYENAFTYYPFTGNLSALKPVLPLPGDKVSIQMLGNDLNGERADVFVDSLFYHPEGKLLIKCVKLSEEESKRFIIKPRPFISVIGSRRYRDSTHNTPLDTSIPDKIRTKLAQLAGEQEKENKTNQVYRRAETAVQAFYFRNRYNSSEIQTLYALVIYSCCYEGGSKGYIAVCNAAGEELWRSEEGFYYGKPYITDVDNDSNSELIFSPLNGDSLIKLILPYADFNSGKFKPRVIFNFYSPFNRDSGC